MKVSIEEINSMTYRRQRINSCPLEQITFTKDGKPLRIPLDKIRDFELCGLDNIDFITTGAYKEIK